MALIKHRLTFSFQRTISVSTGKPVELEIVITGLDDPVSGVQASTLVGPPVVQKVLLGNDVNPIYFDLVSSDDSALPARMQYRVEWREGFGAITSTDFYMLDRDVDFNALGDLGQIVDTSVYLRESDLGVAGRVAKLNDAGQVLDADGNVVGGTGDAAAVQGQLDAFKVTEQQDVSSLRTFLLGYVADQVTSINNTVITRVQTAVDALSNADLTEKTQRQAAVAALNNTLSTLQDTLNTDIATINDEIASMTDQLANTPQLVGGKIPSQYIPSIAIGHAVSVANQSAMLALTTADVQQGDFAIRPDGVWILNGTDPSQLGSWLQFTIAAAVLSVNGHTGAVVLSASDVNARPAGVNLNISEVNGLQGAIDGKASTTTTSGLNSRISTIEGDTTIVRTVSGLIAKALMPADAAFVNTSNLVTKKDGTVLNLGSGGTLDISDVTGLQTALDSKLDADDPSVTNARTPTVHHTTHATGGDDPIAPADIGAATASHTHAESDVTGLNTALTNHGNRISSLETRVTALEAGGGGGGGGGSPAKSIWFDGPSPASATDSAVLQKGPFGYNPSNPDANADGYYYDPAGAADGEWVWPYLDSTGHLKFLVRNETNPPAPAYAVQTDLDTLSALVATKADESEIGPINTALGQKASLSAFNTLSTLVGTKADQSALDALTTTVGTKASQASVDALSTSKADQSDLDALTTVVDGKADQTDVDGLGTRLTTVETALPLKADLSGSGGTLQLSQVPTGIPESKIIGLVSDLAGKPSTTVTDGLNTRLTTVETDATIVRTVSGKIPTSVMPTLALTTSVPVSNRAALLALTTSQVQPGDLGIITTGADKGTYMLMATDPSVFSNWQLLSQPDAPVQSVNGQTGTVVLDATAVGAYSSASPISQANVSGLGTALAAKADVTYVNTQLATKIGLSDMRAEEQSSPQNKQAAVLVATSPVLSLSGTQSIDSTLAGIGQTVLLTNQASSTQNGLWVVASGAWSRASDMATGSYFTRGALVVVTGGSTTNAGTLWQQTNTSGVVGTDLNNWTRVGYVAAPVAYTASNGVQRVGNDFRAQVVSGGGLVASSGGLAVDTAAVPKKFTADSGSTAWPVGSTTPTVTHGLGTTAITYSVFDKASGAEVLVGGSRTGVNTLVLDFANAPTSGQYTITVIG